MSRTLHRQRSRGQGGFTLIEVMMSLAILMVGAVGILGLQQASTRGNVEGRMMTNATTATSTWLERLRRDSLQWTESGQTATSLTNTRYLSSIDGTWVQPNPIDPNESWGFDWLGNDTRNAADIRFCSHIQLSWAVTGQTIRADVRTVYARYRDGEQQLVATCDPAAITAELETPAPGLSAVYASTLLRWTPNE